MAIIHTTRRVYSAEELHRLRNTKSQPRLNEAIEEHDGDDAELVKEHVLRGSKSFAARSWKSRASCNSLRVPSSNKENRSASPSDPELHAPVGRVVSGTAPILGEIAPNNQVTRAAPYRLRRSPTSSLKRRKVEAIVKAHGSPTHVRVTAGGRIVPSEQSPLCHPRYGYSAIKSNGGLVKFAPNHPMGKTQQWTQATQATQNGFIAQDVNGRLCQIINGTVLPLNEIDGALQLFMPAPNLNITQRSQFPGSGSGRFSQSGNQQHITAPSGNRPVAQEPSPSTQANALELKYSKLELELKEVDKTEVLHGRTMGKAAKDALVTKRRELVMSLDKVRKALKGIKDQAPLNAPTSPRAMQNRASVSPPRHQVAPFMPPRPAGNMMQMPAAPPQMYGPYFGPPPFTDPYAFQATPPPDTAFNGQSWPMPPPGPGMFVPPPPFDGSMSAATLPYPEHFKQSARPNDASDSQPDDTHLPQTDGAGSLRDVPRVASPRQSRALPIKIPDAKTAGNLKSSLNPMSPAYKPGVGVLKNDNRSNKSTENRAPTPLSPRRELQPQSAASSRKANATDETISPTKKSPHVQSSSVSSFETADFFPRNTREYSTRRDAYPPTEDKENMEPSRQDSKVDDSSPADSGHRAPPPPPGTPTTATRMTRNGSSANDYDDDGKVIPDRERHNMSPKTKRQDWMFIEEHPERDDLPPLPLSSPVKTQVSMNGPRIAPGLVDGVEFPSKSREWIEGYQAGLKHYPVGAERKGDFLNGYCSGLLKSSAATLEPSTGSPTKPASRRPSPIPIQGRPSNVPQQDRRSTNTPRPLLMPFEASLHSFDTLKQAVYDPQNENAILTPTAEGPHANEPPFNLGAWAKSHDTGIPAHAGMTGFQFPDPSLSNVQRRHESEEECGPKGETLHNMGPAASFSAPGYPFPHHQLPPLPSSPAMTATSLAPSSVFTGNNNRVSSMTSNGSSIFQHYPGHRIISPHMDWKSASSVAQHTGLATGYFAHAQFGGVQEALRPGQVTNNPAMYQHSRFKEGSLDGVSNPPLSPAPQSPQSSPRKSSPSKDKSKDSPNKGGSPARAKFEHIAEKVGIKVISTKDGVEPGSPPGKRRWRDVWRGPRKDLSRDETV